MSSHMSGEGSSGVSRRRAAIYTSDDHRGGWGADVGRQEKYCRELAARLGADVVHVLVDNDTSAYSGKPRPGYLQLLDLVAAGEVDVVLAWHLDRLHRSPTELEDWIRLADQMDVPVQTEYVERG